MDKFIWIGHTRLNIKYIVRYHPVSLKHDAFRIDLKNEFAVEIIDVSGKALKLECSSWDNCQALLNRLDNLMQPERILLPEDDPAQET